MSSELVYDLVVNQYVRGLNAAVSLLAKAQAHAEQRGFDANSFLDTKLAPDMFSFKKQIQIVSDNAKATVARLAGKDIPSYADNEASLSDLNTRLEKTIAFVKSFKADDFKNWESTKASFAWNPGKSLNGRDYLASFALPNFYFHLTTAYALLRAAGVAVGKIDYLGDINWQNG